MLLKSFRKENYNVITLFTPVSKHLGAKSPIEKLKTGKTDYQNVV